MRDWDVRSRGLRNRDAHTSRLLERRQLWPNRCDALVAIRTSFVAGLRQGTILDGGHLVRVGMYCQDQSTPLSITFAFVATHNHFVLDRGGKVFKQSAPVIKLPVGASEDEHWRCSGCSTRRRRASG